MLHMLTRLLGRHVRNSIAIRSGITDFIAQFFAAELRAWRGEQPLWKVFWLYGVATSSAMIAIYVIAFFIDRVALRQILLLCFAPYTAWILVSVWRCADNTHEWLWTLLARFLTVAWACNTIMVLVFLQINLITRYYLRY
jgi:hypothetical protein